MITSGGTSCHLRIAEKRVSLSHTHCSLLQSMYIDYMNDDRNGLWSSLELTLEFVVPCLTKERKINSALLIENQFKWFFTEFNYCSERYDLKKKKQKKLQTFSMPSRLYHREIGQLKETQKVCGKLYGDWSR